jgi:glutathione S-transferase
MLRKENSVRLITIPVSHYCEKARWALTRLEIPFTEERHLPLFHQFATGKVGGKSVPVLITKSEVLTDSVAILKWADRNTPSANKLYLPEAEQQIELLVDKFDTVLGPAVRQWAYFYLLDRAELVKPLWCEGIPWYEKLTFPILYKAIAKKITKGYKINSESASEAYKTICETFQTVENLLADGRTYLTGDCFSAADLTFAALAAVVVSPSEYGVKLPDTDKLPVKMTDQMRMFQNSVTGKFVLRLYEERGHLTQS